MTYRALPYLLLTTELHLKSPMYTLLYLAEPADERVEGGNYISPEFQLGQVYDGEADVVADVILYRPVYVCLQSRTESQSAATDEQDQDGASPAGSNGALDLCPRKVDAGSPTTVEAKEKPYDGNDEATSLLKPFSTATVRDVIKPTAKDGQTRTSPMTTTLGSGTTS